MENVADQIFKTFHHIAREVQIYFLSGFLVLMNCLLLDSLYFDYSLIGYINLHGLAIPFAILAYATGHFCMAVYYIAFEVTNLERFVKEKLSLGGRINRTALPQLYSRNKEQYLHFVERYVILSEMRATLAAASFLNFVTDVAFTQVIPLKWQLWVASLVFGVSWLAFFVLTCRTDHDYADRVNGLMNESAGASSS